MIQQLIHWLRVWRIQTAFTTVSVLLIGYISVEPLNLIHGAILVVVGLLDHMWGISQNEFYDLEHDKEDPGKQDRPLVRGDLPPRRVYIVSIVLITVAFILIVSISIKAALLFFLSTIFGWHYNAYNKGPFIRAYLGHMRSELSFSSWGAMLVLVGAMAAGDLNVISIMLSIFIFFELFYLNSLVGELKDITSDEENLVEKMGLNLSRDNTFILYSRAFIASVYLSKLIQLFVLSVVLYNINPSPLISSIVIIFGVFFIVTLARTMPTEFDRHLIKSRLAQHGLTSLGLLAISLSQLDMYTAIFILVVPGIWFIALNMILESTVFDVGI